MPKCKVFYGDKIIAEIDVDQSIIDSGIGNLVVLYDTGLLDERPDRLRYMMPLYGQFQLRIIRPGDPEAWLGEPILISGVPSLSGPPKHARHVADGEDFVETNNRHAQPIFDEWLKNLRAQVST